MLAIIAALSLMQAGEEVSDNYRLLSELADCPTAETCVELLERAYGQRDQRSELRGDVSGIYPHVARAAFRHHGRAGLEAMIAWGERSTGRADVAERIVARWPFTSQGDIERAQRFVENNETNWFIRAAALRPAGELDALAAGRTSSEMISTFGYFAAPAIFAAIDLEYLDTPDLLGLSAGDRYLLADDWSRLAADPAQSEERRKMALLGLIELRDTGHPYIHRVARADFGDPDWELVLFANDARSVALDPTYAVHQIAECVARLAAVEALTEPHTAPESNPENYWNAVRNVESCLSFVADFGRDARPHAAPLRTFLQTENLHLRIYLMQTLAHLGDEAVLPALRNALQSTEWSEVYAAVRAFRITGVGPDAERIGRVAESHWLPLVRDAADALTQFHANAAPTGRERAARPVGESVRGSASAARLPYTMWIPEEPRLWSPRVGWQAS